MSVKIKIKLSLVLVLLFVCPAFANNSVWQCWETSYKYEYNSMTDTVDFSKPENSSQSSHNTEIIKYNVTKSDNTVIFRDYHLHYYFSGLLQFNSSEEYDEYYTNYWNFDSVTNTSEIRYIYLPEERKICLSDYQGNLAYANLSLPINLIELSEKFGSSLFIIGWLLPTNVPDFGFIQDYSAFDQYYSVEEGSYSLTHKATIRSSFLFNGRIIRGYNVVLRTSERTILSGNTNLANTVEITYHYSSSGILYNYELYQKYTSAEDNIEVTYTRHISLVEPLSNVGGTLLWPIIIGAIGAVVIAIVSPIIIIRLKK